MTNEIYKIIESRAEEIKKKYSWYEDGDYNIVGIRSQYEPFELGELDHVSKVWDDGNETEEELDGVSITSIDDYRESKSYGGEHVAIIVGNRGFGGEDLGELVVEDPVVVEILA